MNFFCFAKTTPKINALYPHQNMAWRINVWNYEGHSITLNGDKII